MFISKHNIRNSSSSSSLPPTQPPTVRNSVDANFATISAKYTRMLSVGVPLDAVLNNMSRDGVGAHFIKQFQDSIPSSNESLAELTEPFINIPRSKQLLLPPHFAR